MEVLKIRFNRNAEIREIKARFRALRGWRITWNGQTRYKSETWIDPSRRRATICAYRQKDEPPHYLLHEILHVVLAACEHGDPKVQREREEQFIEDVCELFRFRVEREQAHANAICAGCGAKLDTWRKDVEIVVDPCEQCTDNAVGKRSDKV